ncbi:zinc-binding alcohol dehydrogenase family protein [Actinoplanes sp. N902-109]|uniref:quinone oxidoreductase family protein n=1 Tax=Actinoplanes sp. (strain N902-109) TaxID=649831 RepID=UPI00032967BD|nr:zinc-binding alcohol dehydrogenase family protein [Actinoplanes sp. N902-109]AGL16441.1 alcohol dehydrogenase zinc-binding domain protein [Actinoplanes sp. N902-109]
MQVAQLERFGEAPVAAQAPDPEPASGHTLVEVRMSALNPFDLRVAGGEFYIRPPLPYVPGSEGAGVVLHSDRWPAGTRVRFGASAPGGFAQRVLVPDDQLMEIPDEVPDAVAAALGVAGLAAWGGLDVGRFRSGERVLVLGASGAVGRLALQAARIRNASRVVGVGRDAKALAELVGPQGADAVVTLQQRDAADLAQAITAAAGGPVDVVIDLLWGEPALAGVMAAGTGARLVCIGDAAGPTLALPAPLIRSRQIEVRGYTNLALSPEHQRAALRSLFQHAAAGRIQLEHEVFPLDQIATAWRRQAGSPHRKLLLQL